MPSKEQVINVESLPMKIKSGGVYSIMQSNPNSYTHGMFKYPCKFIPEIPRWAIKKYLKGKQECVFDPFSGSGTTLLEANINGYNAWGTEIDDIAKLIIEVKTTKLSTKEMMDLEIEYEKIKKALLVKTSNVFIPRINNLEHWFTQDAITKLGRIKKCIDEIENPRIRNFMSLCFASIIKRVSNADDASPKPYVSKKIVKNPPLVDKEFSNIYKRYRDMMQELLDTEKFGQTQIIEGNALEFDVERKINLAITSPPYINAFDYGRTMRLENLWLETLTEEQLRVKKKDYVGTEKISAKEEVKELSILNNSKLLQSYYCEIDKTDSKRALIVKRFFEDMEQNLRCVYRQLEYGGKYVIVIGNSTIRGINIESWKVIRDIGLKIGFIDLEHFSYIIQNPYIRIPRNGKGGKVNQDYVIVLGKEKNNGSEE